jgi:predicted tellurium resistance membrane protein TerC
MMTIARFVIHRAAAARRDYVSGTSALQKATVAIGASAGKSASAMELLSAEFLAALLSIVVIDLVLAGDNAIVIALAARNVPRHLQKRAILWGTVGAIVVRSAMTLIVVWLLKVPGLLLVGGAALVWIAYRLLLPEEAHSGGATPMASQLLERHADDRRRRRGDGAGQRARGRGGGARELPARRAGLLISVPIVVWGSTLMLRLVERHPLIVYVGAGVLAWTAAKMITTEPETREGIRRVRIHAAAHLCRARLRRAVDGLRPQSPQARIAHQRAPGGPRRRRAERAAGPHPMEADRCKKSSYPWTARATPSMRCARSSTSSCAIRRSKCTC